MAKFDLKDILSNRSKEMDIQEKEYKTDGVVELVDIYDMIPSQDNFYSTDAIMDLVNSIKLVGILQPLLLSESEEADKFGIKAGHRRREALLYLVEKEGLEQYRYAPAIIKQEQDDVIGKLTIIMANRFREKSDWEKMQEAIQTEELLAELKGNRNLNKNTREQLKEMLGIEGDENLKTRDFVAQILGISQAQVGRYKAIYNNLCLELMHMFKEKLINVSVAAELAGLSPDSQSYAYEMLRDKGSLQISDVKDLKRKEEENKPIEGQIKIDEVMTKTSLPLTDENKENAIEFIFDECHDKSFQKEEMEKIVDLFKQRKGEAYGYVSQQLIFDRLLPFENDVVKVSRNCGYRVDFVHTNEYITIPIYYFWKAFEEHYGWMWGAEKKKIARTCGATQEPCNFENNREVAKSLDIECEVECCAKCEKQCGARCNYAAHNTAQKEEPKQFEADPEYKDVLCYSCLHYSECDKKAGTVFKCDSYVNKADAEKTEEQLYSEEQDRIDRETAKKIEEMRQEEDRVLPKGDKRPARDDFEITVTVRQYAEVYYGHINFLVTLKKDYQFDDKITLKEYCKGEPTGKELVVKVKNVVQDCTGIEDGYCVIGFYTIGAKNESRVD